MSRPNTTRDAPGMATGASMPGVPLIAPDEPWSLTQPGRASALGSMGMAYADSRLVPRGSAMPVERASRVGYLVDLDEQARANHDTYTTAKKASDGLEHGFLEPSRD